MENNQRLIIITRQDLSSGYQTAQSVHAATEFAYLYPIEFKQWRENGNYVIALAVPNEQALLRFMDGCASIGLTFIKFEEADIEEVTAIALIPNKLADTVTKYFPLAGTTTGAIDKHNNALHGLASD